MSNHWDLECRDCSATCDLELNHAGDYIQELIHHIPDIARVEPVYEILSEKFDVSIPMQLVWFAQAHEGHDLIAVDEYGADHGECVKRYECGCCGTRLRCRKPVDHEGDCGKPEVSE